jgi:hypothetical protein
MEQPGVNASANLTCRTIHCRRHPSAIRDGFGRIHGQEGPETCRSNYRVVLVDDDGKAAIKEMWAWNYTLGVYLITKARLLLIGLV